MAYNTNVFVDNKLIKNDLPELRQNAVTTNTAFSADHAPLSTSDDTAGNHTTIRFVNRTSHPTDDKDSFYVLNDNGVKRLYARFGSVSGNTPLQVVASGGSETASGVRVANNPGTAAGSINYIDTLEGTRKYWGQVSLSTVSLRTTGQTVILPVVYSQLITAYGYFTSADSVDITSSNNSIFAGVIVESSSNQTFNFLAHLGTGASDSVGMNWYAEVINANP